MKIRPITGSKAAADVAADLRDLADLVEGDDFLANVVARMCARDVWPYHSASHEHEDQRREVMAETVRRFKTIAAGPVVKDYEQHGGGYFTATVPLRALAIELVDVRAAVCERVVTSVETVTEEIVDPDYVAPTPPMITRTREVETVEWRCAPLLAASPVELSQDQA